MTQNSLPETGFELKPTDTLVIETGASKYQQAIRTAGHVLTADEPITDGGKNTGPNPYDLLLSALGACTAMTIRMYADFKKIPLQRVAVKLSHEKIHAEDCKDCETDQGMVDEIKREIDLIGDELTDDQRQKMLEIANKCPVHKTLHSEIKVRTKLKT